MAEQAGFRTLFPSGLRRFWLCVAILVAAGSGRVPAEEPKPVKTLPLPGESFLIEQRPAFLIVPQEKDQHSGKPWVWYAPTLPGLPATEENWMFQKFLAAGIAIGGIDVGESYGSPNGRKLFTAYYKELTEQRGFSRKPALLARSRGGLMLYNWAVENPGSVGCIAFTPCLGITW